MQSTSWETLDWKKHKLESRLPAAAAAAKSLQSCPTLCDPMVCSLPGSSVHGIFQARVLEWVAISFPRGIFPTQGLNPCLPHCRQTLLPSEPPGKSTNWKILQKIGIPDHLTCLLRNLYTGQEATVRTRHGTTDWFQTGKEVIQGCIFTPCLFNFNAECIMQNARLDEAQTGIYTARRNINNLRYANDITLMEESKEELKNLWKWKRRVKKLA